MTNVKAMESSPGLTVVSTLVNGRMESSMAEAHTLLRKEVRCETENGKTARK
jgi:hypothetical protein